MRKIKPVKLSGKNNRTLLKGYAESIIKLEKKVNLLIEENNRKNDEIRQIKSKLRVNAHFSKK